MRKLVSLSISIFVVIVAINDTLSAPLICLNGGEGSTEFNTRVLSNNNDPSILYLGNWVFTPDASGFYLNDFKASNTQYNRCLLTFRGPFVKWYGSKNNNHGLADIYIDDVFMKSVDTYNATLITNALLFEAQGLKTDELHTLVIVVRKEKNEKSIGCFQDIDYFESAQPVNYADEIKNLMNSEYAQIRNNKKPYASPASWTPVSYVTNAPVNGVTLQSGMFNDIFTRNIKLLNNSFSSSTYCYGVGWSKYLPGSVEGRLLSGAANTLRWGERTDMRNIIDTIVYKIKNRVRQDGYHNYYSEELYTLTKGADSERKNYDRVFWTRGLLDAGKSGNSFAYTIARNFYDWFNQSPYLPNMLLGSNATNGIPGGGLMYHSPVGVENDLIVTMKYFDQDYWIEELIKRQPLCISNYPGVHPHCYELLGLEAFLDEYIATGLQKYIDAVKGGWEVYNTNFENIGGTTAIGEGNYYPPRSYYLYPTKTGEGETCGSVFWTNINCKLLHLYPDEEKYASEIEKSIYNVLMAAQDTNGNIGGYNHLHGQKEINSYFYGYCCEASTEGMMSSKLPEYIFSIAQDGLYINLFTASTISWEMHGTNITLKMITEFPKDPNVMITVLGTHNKKVNIRFRVPSWASGNMAIYVNGSVAATGTPGSYVSVNRKWMDNDKISFVLPIALNTIKYTGFDQVNGNLDRYALLYGPILMALKGPLKGPDGVPHISTTLAGLAKLLTPISDSPLQFNVEGYPAYKYLPYWQVSGTFTCFPIIQP
jgi:uncharacterized protein